jgi:hypothetical protein
MRKALSIPYLTLRTLQGGVNKDDEEKLEQAR